MSTSKRRSTLAKAAVFLNRAAAGIVTAWLTGTFAGVALTCYVLLTGGPPGPGADLLGGSIWIVGMASIVGALLGAPSGILIMCLSRAKAAPWRAVPTLLLGTTIGIVTLGLPWELLPGTDVTASILDVMCIAGPTLGGVVAARFIPKTQNA